MRLPVFDISVRAQKNSPFARISQNELAKEFYQMGFFAPENAVQALSCMEMMDFEGKAQIMAKIRKNAGLSGEAEGEAQIRAKANKDPLRRAVNSAVLLRGQ